MKVLYTNFHAHHGGGHDTYILSLIKNPEIDAYVACPETSDLYRKLQNIGFENLFPINFASKPAELANVYKDYKLLTRLIRDLNIDIVHTNGSPDNRLTLYVKMFSSNKFKVCYTRHNSFPINNAVSRLRLTKFNNAIIVVSDSIYNTLPFLRENNKAKLIRNGIDLTKWQPNYLKKGSTINLVSIAGIKDYKGWFFLIDALKRLPEDKRRRFTVSLAGDIPNQEKIDQVFAEHDVLQQVTFTGPLDDPSSLLTDADIGFVLSHQIETISFACREMMAAGLPVIVSNFGGLPENITAGQDGWITEVANPDSIAKVLTNILSMDEKALLTMKKNARIKAEADFSIEYMLKETQQVYRSLVAN